jgi:hypothetical protein
MKHQYLLELIVMQQLHTLLNTLQKSLKRKQEITPKDFFIEVLKFVNTEKAGSNSLSVIYTSSMITQKY